MNEAQIIEAWGLNQEADYLAWMDSQDELAEREESRLQDEARYMVECFLRNPSTPTENFITYTVEQSLDETMTCSDEPHTLAFLDLARRAAIGENVQTLARELLGKLATEWVQSNRETYLKG